MRVLPAQVQGLAANLRRYRDTVTDPDLTHCPLVFREGREIPLQAALEECMQTSEQPQWSIQERGMHFGRWHAPAPGLVPPPLPTLSAEDFPVKGLDIRSVVGTSDGGPPSPAPGYMPVISKHSCGSYHSEFLKEPCSKLALDASTFASTASTSSTMSIASSASTMEQRPESPHRDLVLRSPEYAVASLKVTDLLIQLRRTGAF